MTLAETIQGIRAIGVEDCRAAIDMVDAAKAPLTHWTTLAPVRSQLSQECWSLVHEHILDRSLHSEHHSQIGVFEWAVKMRTEIESWGDLDAEDLQHEIIDFNSCAEEHMQSVEFCLMEFRELREVERTGCSP